MNGKTLTQLVICILPLLLLSSLFISTVHSVPPITQHTLIVDINGNGDYTNIQEAINDAVTTDIIEIKEGIYKENNLLIDKKVTITGEDLSNTIIDCSGETGFILATTYIELNNLKITNAGEYTIKVTEESDGCIISNCAIDKYGADTGIFIGASSVVVANCNVSGFDSTGIGINVPQSNNIIEGCTIQGFDIGIMVLRNAHDNKILNCNIINNQAGIDFRINAHDNIVSECNIYSNTKGIYTWQSSNYNLIYRNNFWKNDRNALDESNNSWDNGARGNYWDSYRGEDNDNNGIGDTPYIVSGENKDRYPIMIMLLPDVITLPTNIKRTTSMSDSTPSFTWTSSVYSKEIKGYYVKIDENKETFISNKTSWTSPTNISDGAHVFYIRAETIDNTSSRYAALVFYVYSSVNASLVDSDTDGIPDIEEDDLGSDPENSGDVEKIYPGGNPYFLVDVNQDGSFDVLYSSATKTTNAIEKSDDTYLIETDGDEEWDYVYDTTDGAISTYSEESSTVQPFDMWTIIIPALTLAILAVISIIAWYYIKNVRAESKYPRYKEYKKPERKPVALPAIKKSLVKIPNTERRYTVEMMSETRTLLHKIERDFAEYVENLHQLDEEIEEASQETENEEVYRRPKKFDMEDMEDIEDEVDKLSSELSKK